MTDWPDALLAARLFAVDPAGTGLVLRAPHGPARDGWLAAWRSELGGCGVRRMPAGIPDDRLVGGLDLAATLQAGRPIHTRGLLAEAEVLVIPMAERLSPGTVARLAAARDAGGAFAIAALDEGVGPEEQPPAALLDRLAFHLDLTEARAGDLPQPCDLAAARARLPGVAADEAVTEALCTTAAALGIVSLRAPLLALRVARAAAALAGRDAVSAEDAAVAGRLVLAPRAVSIPAEASAEDSPDDAPSDDPSNDPGSAESQPDDTMSTAGALDDIVLQAAQAAIPAGLLAQLRAPDTARQRARTPGVAGALHRATQRGRPAGVRPGDPRTGLRLNLIETLRAAAPWQRLRRPPGSARVAVRRDDFRVTQLTQRAETTTIFVVDASGSAALNRLAETKGAVELLLAECYVRRDRVAVVAFRGRAAQVVLPPTRSLVRAKRSLAGLPGGGGTPLAAGIEAGGALAAAVRRRGGTPVLVLLTDGRPNVARDGTGNRAQAAKDASHAARQLRGMSVLLVDTSPRPHPPARQLAMEMQARYVPLPYADAAGLARAVQAAG